MAVIIDGKKIAAEIREDVGREVAALKEKTGRVPGLGVVLVGNDPASAVYVRLKGRASEEAGIKSVQHTLPADASLEKLRAIVGELNADPAISGVLVQLPLPPHLIEPEIINEIDPIKDVDGIHPVNMGKLVKGDEDCYLPCTPYGCRELINRFVSEPRGKHLVVVGRSNIVGKPIANMMMQKNKSADCIVTVCHTAARDIGLYTRQADILVVAAGRPGMITGDMVKPGAVVIDVGINRVADPHDATKTRLVGDVDFNEVSKIASAITPVPGGVGPMTIAMLMKNTLKAFKIQNGISG